MLPKHEHQRALSISASSVSRLLSARNQTLLFLDQPFATEHQPSDIQDNGRKFGMTRLSFVHITPSRKYARFLKRAVAIP